MIPGDVRCGDCRACCKRRTPAEAVRVSARFGDDVKSYKTQGGRLATLPNGDCFYLGPGGCRIYARRPALCRRFDCRVVVNLFDQLPPGKRIEAKADFAPEILVAGRARLGGGNK